MRIRILITAAVMLAALQGGAVDKTTRKGRLVPRADRTAVEVAAAPRDTIVPAPGVLVFAGYDKPLDSRRESLFLTNNSPAPICSVLLELTYVDPSGRMLHRRSLWVDAQVPPGETRRLDFPSWDRTRTFYYLGGAKPRRDKAAPYDVRVKAPMAVTPADADDAP